MLRYQLIEHGVLKYCWTGSPKCHWGKLSYTNDQSLYSPIPYVLCLYCIYHHQIPTYCVIHFSNFRKTQLLVETIVCKRFKNFCYYNNEVHGFKLQQMRSQELQST